MLDNSRYYINNNIYLTKREVECLYWKSLGKTDKEIAKILDITERTVKAHMTNSKDKLNCINLFQLGIEYNKYFN